MIVTARLQFDNDADGHEFMNCFDQWVVDCEWSVTSIELYQEGAE